MAHSGRHSADELLLAALARGLTIRSAAAEALVSERTATRRMADPDFRRRISELRSRCVQESAGKLTFSMADAVETLRQLLKSSDESIRLRTACKMLEMGMKLWDKVDLEERLSMLEAQCNP